MANLPRRWLAILDDEVSNPFHEDGQFRTHILSARNCVPSLSKTAYSHCFVHMTLAVDMDVKLNHSLTLFVALRGKASNL